jgi:hypothetical protein
VGFRRSRGRRAQHIGRPRDGGGAVVGEAAPTDFEPGGRTRTRGYWRHDAARIKPGARGAGRRGRRGRRQRFRRGAMPRCLDGEATHIWRQDADRLDGGIWKQDVSRKDVSLGSAMAAWMPPGQTVEARDSIVSPRRAPDNRRQAVDDPAAMSPRGRWLRRRMNRQPCDSTRAVHREKGRLDRRQNRQPCVSTRAVHREKGARTATADPPPQKDPATAAGGSHRRPRT